MKKIIRVVSSLFVLYGFIFTSCGASHKGYHDKRRIKLAAFAARHGFIATIKESNGVSRTCFTKGGTNYTTLRSILEKFPDMLYIPCSYCEKFLIDKESYNIHLAFHHLERKSSKEKDKERMIKLIQSSKKELDGLHLLLAAALTQT